MFAVLCRKEGTMRNKRIKCFLTAALAGSVLLCCCGVEDKAITLPLKEIENGNLPEGGMEEAMVEKEQAQFIYVHVCGEVQKPGVVMVPYGSRRADALAAAGGFTEDACETYVNLAALLVDGEQLYIPGREEGLERKEAQERDTDMLVNINTAGEEKLCTLPGIGSTRARDIIAYRQAHGNFSKKEDIMQVSGIKESIYDKICDRIIVE